MLYHTNQNIPLKVKIILPKKKYTSNGKKEKARRIKQISLGILKIKESI